MTIPKLANGGIINKFKPYTIHRKKAIVVHIDEKGYIIYKRTKSKRIKKKQLTRYPTLSFRLELEKDIAKKIRNKQYQVTTNGEIVIDCR